MEDKTIKIFGDGAQLRDYIFVDDIVSAMLNCAYTPEAIGEVINVGSGSSTRFCDMASLVIKCVDKGKLEFTPWPDNYEKIETGDISIDLSKLKKITDWQLVFSLEEGIKKTFEYYRKWLRYYI